MTTPTNPQPFGRFTTRTCTSRLDHAGNFLTIDARSHGWMWVPLYYPHDNMAFWNIGEIRDVFAFFVVGDSTIELGQNASIACLIFTTAPNSVLIEWTTTALSANISNRQRAPGGFTAEEVLVLTEVDCGHCGVYTCSATDADTQMPQDSSISLSVGEYNIFFLERMTLSRFCMECKVTSVHVWMRWH